MFWLVASKVAVWACEEDIPRQKVASRRIMAAAAVEKGELAHARWETSVGSLCEDAAVQGALMFFIILVFGFVSF